MKITLGQTYSFCQLGLRNNQEDSRYPDSDKPSILPRCFVVCDGVGGSENGEIASKTVCCAISMAMNEINLEKNFGTSEFSKILDIAYDALDRKASCYNKEMATTLAFACFHAGGCTLAHIGDSRIYQFRRGQGAIYRSEDHSLINSMVHNGIMTPDEAIDSLQRNIIIRYMESVEPDQNRSMATVLNTKDVKNGDYIFLCTDGVYNQVDDNEIADILFSTKMSDKVKLSIIAKMCKESDDNNTAILIPVTSVEVDNQEVVSVEASSNTKKIPYLDSTIEEVESIRHQTSHRIINWIKQIFN